MGACFDSFLVGSGADARALRELAARLRLGMVNIVVVNFGLPRHPIPPGKLPANGFLSVMDQVVVDTQDPSLETAILNYLVDRCACLCACACVYVHVCMCMRMVVWCVCAHTSMWWH